MKAHLTAHTEADLLRGIDWFDRIQLVLAKRSRQNFTVP
jgi:hypothetical protein